MNDKKLKALFRSARGDAAPDPSAQFEGRVTNAISQAPRAEPASLMEQLARLFPRIAVGATALICLSLGADLCLTNFVQNDFSTSLAELSQQWLFAAN